MVGFVVQKQIKGHELQLMKVMANTMLMQQPFTSVGAIHEATLLDRVYKRLVYEPMLLHPFRARCAKPWSDWAIMNDMAIC
jgi:hypothetical protein